MFSKMWLLAASLALSGLAHAFSPETGTWVFVEEENGKPGRGLTLDVQNGILVATLYGYEQSGQSSFYTGVGQLNYSPSDISGQQESDVTATIDLVRYSGGRFLGGGARDAVQSGSVGKAEFRFIHGTAGYILLPGESQAKRIARFVFGVPSKSAEQMLGGWFFGTTRYSFDNREYYQESEFFYFNAVKDEVDSRGATVRYAVSDNGRMKCMESLPGFVIMGPTANQLLSRKECVLLDAQGKNLRKYSFIIGSNNSGQGTTQDYQSNGALDSVGKTLFVNRVVDSAGRNIGVGSQPSTYFFGY